VLSDAAVVLGDSTVINITLDKPDVDNLKRNGICVSTNKCFILLDDQAIFDMNKRGILQDEAKQALELIDDDTPPELLSFVLFDYNTGVLGLSFSEPVVPESLNVSALELHSNEGLVISEATDSRRVRLETTVSITQAHSELINLTLSRADLNGVKERTQLCGFERGCFVRVESTFLLDTFGNPLTRIDSSDGDRFAQTLAEDEKGPILVGFSINFDTGALKVTFDEPVKTRELNSEYFTLRSSASSQSTNFTLSAASRILFPTVNTIGGITITADDILAIKAQETLAVSINTTFLELAPSAASDVVDNANQASPDETRGLDLVQAGEYAADTVGPTIVDFSGFNPSSGEIRLSFSEPVTDDFFDASGLTLRTDRNEVAAQSFPLTGPPAGTRLCRFNPCRDAVGYPEGDSSKMTLLIYMSDSDLETVQLNSALAESRDTTFLSVADDSFKDVAGNNASGVTATASLQATLYGEIDEVSLSGYILDLDGGTLNMTFSGAVKPGTTDVDFIFLQSDRTNSTRYALKNSQTITAGDGFELDLRLG
jgi:hypothetical protein